MQQRLQAWHLLAALQMQDQRTACHIPAALVWQSFVLTSSVVASLAESICSRPVPQVAPINVFAQSTVNSSLLQNTCWLTLLAAARA